MVNPPHHYFKVYFKFRSHYDSEVQIFLKYFFKDDEKTPSSTLLGLWKEKKFRLLNEIAIQ